MATRLIDYAQGGVPLQGYLAYDEGRAAAGPLPGVIVIHEWWGRNAHVERRADELAKLGYAAFALDLYGKGVVTTEAKQAGALAGQLHGKPLLAERAQAGLDELLGTGLVDASRVAAIGYCLGGSACQALAFSGAPLAGIVSFHGGLVPVPADAPAKTRAKILMCHGAIDPFIPKAQLDAFLAALNDGKIDYQFNIYGGAVHAFTNPEADAHAAANGLQGIAYSAAADRRSWADMQLFFSEIFGPKQG